MGKPSVADCGSHAVSELARKFNPVQMELMGSGTLPALPRCVAGEHAEERSESQNWRRKPLNFGLSRRRRSIPIRPGAKVLELRAHVSELLLGLREPSTNLKSSDFCRAS